MHQWVYEDKNELSFIFVDYKVTKEGIEILKETPPIPIEHIEWHCFSIEAQGYGVIQKVSNLATWLFFIKDSSQLMLNSEEKRS